MIQGSRRGRGWGFTPPPPPSLLGNLVHTFDFFYEHTHSRRWNANKNMTISKFLMCFKPFARTNRLGGDGCFLLHLQTAQLLLLLLLLAELVRRKFQVRSVQQKLLVLLRRQCRLGLEQHLLVAWQRVAWVQANKKKPRIQHTRERRIVQLGPSLYAGPFTPKSDQLQIPPTA